MFKETRIELLTTGLLSLIATTYFIFILVDVIRFIEFLRSSNWSADRISSFTIVGRYLGFLLDKVQSEWRVLSWQLNSEELRSVSLPSTKWWSDAPKGDEPGDRDEVFFRQLLDFLAQHFRCTGCAIILKNRCKGTKVLSSNVSLRCEQALKELYEGYFQSGDKRFLGYIDHGSGVSETIDLSLLGFRRSLAAALENGTNGDAVIWLGYSNLVTPTDLELKAVGDLATRSAERFRSLQEVVELSEKVVEAKSENEDKTAFITHMSHDIRSPLNNIKAILTLFKLQTRDTETLELIESAEGNCTSLVEIVEGLLDYSKHRVGRLEAEREVVEVDTCLNEVVSSYKVSARLRGLKLIMSNLYPGTGIFADKKQLRRIFANILGNALKYTPSGSVTVELFKAQDGKLRIEISDTGLGMTDGQVKNLFTPFMKFHSGFEGAGLGLSVTRILTELNGGTISVSSRVGKGTTFALEFEPFEIPDVQSHAPEPQSVPEIESFTVTNGIRILLVDDDAECSVSLKRLLTLRGFDVVSVETVNDAMSICNFEAPEVVITDSSMPQGGGSRLLKFLEQMKHKPLVGILSGSSRIRNESSVIDRTFVKPADFSELLRWLNDYCEMKNARKVSGA